MSVRTRLGGRLTAAIVVAAIPISLGAVAPMIVPTSQTVAPPSVDLAADGASDVPAPQRIAPVTTILHGLLLNTRAERRRTISVSSSHGTQTFTASSLADHDVPSAAMRAYKNAARSIDVTDPTCHLTWPLLAGIGRVESNHGRYGGSVLGADGISRPAIVGIALNGKGPVAAIPDTDDGRWDGDTVWDRAVGPMQFIPSTWRTAGRDGDGDGIKNPNDIDDAALAAAAYLCNGGRNLTVDSARRAAIFSYNPSTYYVDLVSAFARGYRTGAFVIPSPPVAPGAGDGVVHLQDGTAGAAKKKAAHEKALAQAAAKAKAEATAKAKAAAKAKAEAAAKAKARREARREARRHPKPSAGPSPSPSPSPSSPQSATVTGPVTAAGGGWQIGTVMLVAADLTPIADQDWDQDGTVEPIATEFDGLVTAGTSMTLTYTTSPFTVTGFGFAP